MTDWARAATPRTFEAKGFVFSDGSSLDVKLHCHTLGTYSAGNAVLLLHGTTGSGQQFLQPGMADWLFGPGRPLDPARYFIVLPDAIGHGGSSKPSDGLRERFPHYGYGDMVAAQHRLVTQELGINRLRLVLGTSMGGMQTWIWGARYPDMVDALMPVASLPQRITGRNLLMRRIIIEAIRSDPEYARVGNGAGLRGVGLAWNVFQMLVNSPARMAEELVDPDAVDEHVRFVAANAVRERDADDVIWEFEASRDYDPEPDLNRITAPLVAVNFADDEVNPAGLGVLARLIAQVPNGRAVTVPTSPHGQGHQSLAKPELWLAELEQLLGTHRT